MMHSRMRILRKPAWFAAVIAGITFVKPALSVSTALGRAPAESADAFVFTAEDFRKYYPVSLGNGYLICATPWNGTAAASSTVVGLYDHLEENAFSYQALI